MFEVLGSILMTLLALAVFGLLLALTIVRFRASEKAVNASLAGQAPRPHTATDAQDGTSRAAR